MGWGGVVRSAWGGVRARKGIASSHTCYRQRAADGRGAQVRRRHGGQRAANAADGRAHSRDNNCSPGFNKSLYCHNPAFEIADLTDDQNASAVKEACERQLFCVAQGKLAAEYCFTCSTVIFPPLTKGNNAESEFWLHERGDCEAVTFVILPLLKVTVAERVP